MKAITIQQPWADLILRGVKRVENRAWRILNADRSLYRGPLAIHAGKLWDQAAIDAMDPWSLCPGLERDPGAYVFGAIVGVVTVIDQVRGETLGDDPWAWGPWCWVLQGPQRLAEPIPCRGRQRIFNVDDPAIIQKLNECLAKEFACDRLFYLALRTHRIGRGEWPGGTWRAEFSATATEVTMMDDHGEVILVETLPSIM